MENNMDLINNSLTNGKNFAAIYARISSLKENNSINAQIALGKEKATKENLLVYASYYDKVSGLSTPPEQRKSFRKLLEDAKSGCFKTLIIYRLDRLVRNFEDWIQIKKTLKKLGIKLIFSDESQQLPEDSPQSEFLNNLTVMMAEIEPDRINLRASEGRKFRRKSGIYNCGKYIPFGYLKVDSKTPEENKVCKSTFVQQDIKNDCIKYLFESFKLLIEKEHSSFGAYIANTYDLRNEFEKLISSLEDFDNDVSILQLASKYKNHKPTEIFLMSIVNKLKIRFNNNPNEIKLLLKEIKHHFLFNPKNKMVRNNNNIDTLLRNPIFAGRMLLNINERTIDSHPKTIDKLYAAGIEKISNNIFKLQIKSFIKTQNLQGCVDCLTFAKVYSHLIGKDCLKEDLTPNFLFKKELKCSCGGRFSMDKRGIICCKKCSNAFIKDEIITIILSSIVNTILENSTTGFLEFKLNIENKINALEKFLNKLQLLKAQLTEEYLLSKNEEFKDIIYKKIIEINKNKNLCCEYKSELSYITYIENLINSLGYSKDDLSVKNIELKNKIISETINYILDNEERFHSILKNIISEIRMVIEKDATKSTIKVKINYKFTPSKNSDIR